MAATRGDGGIAVAVRADGPSKNLTIGAPVSAKPLPRSAIPTTDFFANQG